MEKLTAQEALKKTLLIWRNIAKTGDYKPKVYAKLELEKDQVDCPCCEFAYNIYTEEQNCTICPLYPNSSYGCEQEGEPYRLYCDATECEDIKEAGREMVALLEQRLKEFSK
jgi:hypothetical protein